MAFVRASGCKYPKCTLCGHDKILDPHHVHHTNLPSSQVVGGCVVCEGEGVEIIISVKLSLRSIILCLITVGVVTVLTLLIIRCIELSLSGSVIG